MAHLQSHAITSTTNHTSTATPGKMLKADANGLPVDATNTDAQVSAAVSASHTQGTDTTLGTQAEPLDMGGYTIQNVGDAVNPTDAVNLNTLLDHIGITLNYWFGASDVMSTTFTAGSASEAETVTSSPQTLSNIFFKSTVVDTPTPFTIKANTLILHHMRAKVTTTAGKKNVTLKVQLGYVDADGTSNFVQIGSDSDETANLTASEVEYELHMHVTSDTTVPAGKRLWLKFVATTNGAGNDPEVNVWHGDEVDHLLIPVAASVLGNFANTDLSNLSATGEARFSSNVTAVTGTAPIVSSGGTTPAISITAASSTDPGSMSAADKAKMDAFDLYTAHAKWSFAVDGGAVSTITPVDSDSIPNNAIIVSGVWNSTTAVTSGGTTTIAIGVANNATNTLKTATSKGTYSLDAVGELTTPPLKLTAAGAITFTIATNAATAGVIEVWVQYWVAAA